MTTIAPAFALILALTLTSFGNEAKPSDLVTKALVERKKFNSKKERLSELINTHNHSKPDRNGKVSLALLQAMASIQKPFEESVRKLGSIIKSGEPIGNYPGILALGKIRFDSSTQTYTLEINFGYGDYEGSWQLVPRSYSIKFDATGKLLNTADSLVPETE